MKRTLFVVATGLIGILLGIGLSLAAAAVVGNDLSEPVPLGISPSVGTPTATRTAEHGTPSPAGTRDRQHDRNDDHGGSSSGGSGPSISSGSGASTHEDAHTSGGSDDSSGESSHDSGSESGGDD